MSVTTRIRIISVLCKHTSRCLPWPGRGGAASCPRICLLLLPLLVLLTCQPVYSQKYNRYRNYSTSDGLSSNNVDCMLQDSYGFLWVGTWDGLNRFDGHEFKQYKTKNSSPHSIKGNWIYNIFEDSARNVWVCTSGGLVRYNRTYDNFDECAVLDRLPVKFITFVPGGTMMVSSSNGLYHYDYRNDKILNIFREYNSPDSLPTNELSEMVTDKLNNLWIASENSGLIYFNTKTRAFTKYISNQLSPTSIASDKIRSIALDGNGKLWVGTYNEGISIMDTSTKQCRHLRHNKNNPKSLRSNSVNKIFCDKNNTIWICCQNGFLNRYNRLSDDFHHFETNPYVSTCLQTEAISCTYEDSFGNIWIGTHGKGVAFLNRLHNRFKSYIILPEANNTLRNNKITSFVEMDDSMIVVATDGGGFCIFDPREETFKTFNTSNGLVSNNITQLRRGSRNTLWMATWGGGIAEFSYPTGSIKNYVNNKSDNNSLVFNNIKSIYPDSNYVWVVTHGEGISLFNSATKQFVSHKSSGHKPFDLRKPTWGNMVIKDSKNRYWFSTYNGLYLYDGSKLTGFKNHVDDTLSLISDNVRSVFEDYYHTIWIITDKGIEIFNEKNNTFVHATQLYNLPPSAKVMAEDKHHRLWIGSSDGLTCFDPRTLSSTISTKDDGVPSNNFLNSSTLTLRNGNLLFGGTDGFVMFNPDSLRPTTNKPRVLLVNLRINHELQTPGDSGSAIKKSIQCTDTLIFKYSNSVITFECAGLDLSNPEVLTYSYQLQGLNNNWIMLGKNRTITVSNLAAGTYLLVVKACKPNGICNTNGAGLTIIIMPPWWQQWWCRLLQVFAIIGTTGAFIYLRLLRVKRTNKLLEQVVKERTEELVKANNELKDVNNMKNKLFSIIAHDLKNPIGTLIGFSTLIVDRYDTMKSEKKLEYISLILKSSKNIHQQLEQLLNWAMTQSNNANPFPQPTDLSLLVNDTLVLLNEMSHAKNISLNTKFKTSRLAYVDINMTATIIRNLITNALKFTPAGGTITITVEESPHTIDLVIADTGIGISPERLQSLFNLDQLRATYGTNREKGTGLGLIICKDFTEKNNGSLSVTSTVGQGSSFKCSFPPASNLDSTQAL